MTVRTHSGQAKVSFARIFCCDDSIGVGRAAQQHAFESISTRTASGRIVLPPPPRRPTRWPLPLHNARKVRRTHQRMTSSRSHGEQASISLSGRSKRAVPQPSSPWLVTLCALPLVDPQSSLSDTPPQNQLRMCGSRCSLTGALVNAEGCTRCAAQVPTARCAICATRASAQCESGVAYGSV
jgi:hypothetical protein